MACNHKLDANYIGLYCIYCGSEAAQIAQEDGQLVLRNEKKRKYVAVVYNNKQKVVTNVQLDAARATISFRDNENGVNVRTPRVLMAFQESDETLQINDAE